MRQVLVVGTGSIGERHARCFGATGQAEVGIVEPNDALRQAVAARYGIARQYASLDDALGDHAWASAVLCTPAHTHVPLAMQCLTHKLPTLIEKPLAITVQEARPLWHAAQETLVGVAYVYRAHPGLAAMRQAIVQGRFGRPLQVVSTGGQHFPTYRPAYASTYYARHATGGGAIQDALTHTFNAVEWIVGPITRLCCDARQCRLADTQVEDTVHVMARHGQVMASYALNQHQAPNESTLTVVCEQGTVTWERHHDRWMWQADPQGTWQVQLCPLPSRDAWFIAQCESWLDALAGVTLPLCSLAQGLQTLAANEAALRSWQQCTGWVEVDDVLDLMNKE